LTTSWEEEAHLAAWRQPWRGSVRGWFRHRRDWPGEISGAVGSVFFPSGCRICDTLLTRVSPVPLCEARARRFARYENAVVSAIPLLKLEQIEPLGAWLQRAARQNGER